MMCQGPRVPGDEHLRRLRLRSQRLEPRCGDGAAALVRAVCGVQAQDPAAALLSVRARTAALTAGAARADPALVRTWAWRGTLHLLAADDLPWVLPLVAPAAMRGVHARWRRLGLDEATYARARRVAGEALAAEGALSRTRLRERLAAEGVDASGQRLPHLVRRAALEGLLQLRLDGTVAALRLPPPLAREQALAALARRYLDAYGPAEPRDLAAWSGLPAADVRAAWAAVAEELVPVGRLWALSEAPTAPAATTVRLLPGFDTYLLGHRSRDDVVAPAHARSVRPGGGWIHPVLLVDGRAAGTWRTESTAAAMTIAVSPFAALPVAVRRGVEAEAEDVGRFLARPVRLRVKPPAG